MADNEDIIRRGRAYVRLIQATDVLMEKERRQIDRALLEEARRLALQRLSRIVSEFDSAVTAQIMAVSDKRVEL